MVLRLLILALLAPYVTWLVANYDYHLIDNVNLERLSDVEEFKRQMDEMLRGLAETPTAPGHDRVVYPGQLEAEEEQRRLADGIPYHVEVIDWFRQTEERLGLSFTFT